jgi:hypothetical protein
MRYHVTYAPPVMHEGGVEREEIEDGHGACTALVLGSILHLEDGSYSVATSGRDGRTGLDLTDTELWKYWMMLTTQLAESETLSPNKKELCVAIMESIRGALFGMKK